MQQKKPDSSWYEYCHLARLPLFPEKRESAFLGRKRDGNAILKRKNRAPKEDGSLSEQIGHESNTPKPNRTKSSFIGVKSRTNRSSRELSKSGEVDRHAHPGSPYVFGLVGVDHDLDFPEPMPVVGISRSAKGYCIMSVLETMKTYSTDDELTEEALVTKLRTCQYHHLFLHTSLKHNSSGL
ncbi:MUTL protein homolog 1 [Actinidia rufa]|uniref:MUTL protein homolog 1 n=1 Tax=Actinidia rufa TaxID=165716 RepID=A0A7J0E4A8_9ERIC|nr:MUTL protein homolog 1 [Actinidia rufa]